MKALRAVFPLLIVGVMLSVPVVASAATANFFGPIIDPQCHCVGSAPDWGCVLLTFQNLMNLVVSFSVIIFVMVLAYAGILFIASPINPKNREQGRSILTNAVIGILITLSAWLLVDFVMDALYNENTGYDNQTWGPWNKIIDDGSEASRCIVKRDPPEVTVTPGGQGGPSGDGTTTPGSGSSAPVAICTGCMSVPSDIPHKSPAANGCSANGGYMGVQVTKPLTECAVHSSTLNKLENFKKNLASGWEVTEMWPPTTNHNQSCHANGTCVDIASRGASIEDMAVALSKAGFTPVYEANISESECQALYKRIKDRGVDIQIDIRPGNPHFSAYQFSVTTGCK